MTDSQATPHPNIPPLTVSVVSHTHWDREWYHSAARFRQQLVALVDALLTRPADAPGRMPFLLDGQAVVLEDYLSVRPERAADVASSLQSGVLEAGPWYVLADGLIPSAEAIVRNLLAGRRVLRAFGATPPAVAYCPDTFGHPAALPAIANGFNFRTAVLWRGYGGARWPAGDTVRWRGADSSEVLLYHLPPDGYETGSALPSAGAAAAIRWHRLHTQLRARAVTGVALLPNGADHHALQPDVAQAIAALQHAATPDVVVRESLAAFVARLQRAAQPMLHTLPTVSGELRDSYGYTWTLGGTLATRAHQKRSNAHAERLLQRDVEPWLVLAWLHANVRGRQVTTDGAVTLAQAPALLDAAWRTLLRTHPHDTLCGCSIDAVARAMDCRVESARAQAVGLRTVALNLALNHDVVAARERPLAKTACVVVRNRSACWRGGVAEVSLDEMIRDVPVGPSSADLNGDKSADGNSDARTRSNANASTQLTVDALPVQVLRVRERYRRRESPQHYPDNDLVRAHRALVWIPPVPPLGLVVLPLTREQTSESASAGASAGAGNNMSGHRHRAFQDSRFVPASLIVRGDCAELTNASISVTLSPDGVELRSGHRIWQQFLSLETTSDVGDAYTPAIRGEAEMLEIISVTPVARGPLRASAELLLRTRGKPSRIRIRAVISLDAGSDCLCIDLRGSNHRCNHRLRLNVHTDVCGVHADARVEAAPDTTHVAVWADAAFGPVPRPPINVPAVDQQREMVPPTMPMHRWVTLFNAHAGATLHSDGLAEVEAHTESGTLSLTLLRAIGELSRDHLRERPGHAGWPAPIPAAQVQGEFRARVALQLHGEWSAATRDVISHTSDAFLTPLDGHTMRDLQGVEEGMSPLQVCGVELRGHALRFSAATLADDGDGIVLRCVSDSPAAQTGSWTVPDRHPESGVLEFAPARLDETLLAPWQIFASSVEFSAPPRAVVTIRVRRRAP